MEALAILGAGALAVGLAIGLVRGRLHLRETTRREAERVDYQRDKRAQRERRAEASVDSLVDRFFPFARQGLAIARQGGLTGKAGLQKVLEDIDGVRLGMARAALPAVLPFSERRKHLLILGKSGYGKSTIGLHLIQNDLDRGRGICILGSEVELFRDWLLPLVPSVRTKDVIYFRPSDPRCTLTWNPLSLYEGDDRALAAGELFAIFKRAIGETSIGARSDAMLSSAFAVLVGRPGATLLSITRLLTDDQYRNEVVADLDDPYLSEFWARFSDYPANAIFPLTNRLNQFLRLPQLRAALCHPISSFSIRDALAGSQIMFLDVSGLDPDATMLTGQLLLSKFQIELMRREGIPEQDRASMHVYVDEFHVFAGAAEGTWRELLARGRRYGLGLNLLTQHPNQLPRALQHEIFGNVSSIIALNLSAGDASSVRRELLEPNDSDVTKPIPVEDFVSLPVGEGFARLGSGACALRVRFAPPIEKPAMALGERVRDISWKAYAAPPLPNEEVFAAKSSPDHAAGGDTITKSTPGRGGPQHKMLQQLTKEWGEERGFRVTLEETVLGGAGRVDAVLTREDTRMAVEIWVTGSSTEIAQTVGKCIAAGFSHVIVVATESSSCRRAEKTALATVPAKDKGKIRFLTPDGLRLFLDDLSPHAGTQDLTAGYRVNVTAPATAPIPHRRGLARLAGLALLRRGPSS